MRRAAKVDDNHGEIVKAFRKAGATVKPVHQLKGFVDILIGYRGVDQLVEIKDGNKPPSAQKLTEDEEKFWAMWKGREPVIVKSLDEVPEVLKNMTSYNH